MVSKYDKTALSGGFRYRAELECFEALETQDTKLSWRASRVKQPGKRVAQGLF